jgi:hypothetical protein
MTPADENQFREHCATLGVGPDVTVESLERIYVQKSYALIRSGASEEERERLKTAKAALTALLRAEEARAEPVAKPAPRPTVVPPEMEPRLPEKSPFDPTSFDSAWVNILVPPVVAGLAILAVSTPFQFFLQPFQIWVHEFGHATVAWLTGYRALPLPIGWTNMGAEKSLFVYFGIVFLLGVLFVAGLRERKPWPMMIALLIAVLQYYMTWRLPEDTALMWRAFGGIGGEFYLSALMMALFYVELPEKFRWGLCRYFFLFVCAGSFYHVYHFWKQVKRGLEGIPFGSMIHGEEDASGDMNILFDDFSWTNRRIIGTYNGLADACLIVLVAVYLFFAFRLDRLVWRMIRRGQEE